MAIAACLIGAIVLVWGRKEIVNEKSAKNEKVIATQTIEIQENDEIVSGVVLNIIPENKIKEMENKNHKYKKFSN
ncbi:hypothetical protein LK505_05295 [Eubacterium ventriosum]|nr:hypothetical protein [Eubacterium ventriosum]